MHSIKISRYAALAVLLAAATGHAAAQVALTVTPNTVTLPAIGSTATVKIARTDGSLSLTSFVPTLPSTVAGAPYVSLEPQGAAPGATCSPCSVAGEATFTVRLLGNAPSLIGTTQIGLAGQGIAQNSISINLGNSNGGTVTPSALNFTQNDIGPKYLTVSGLSSYALGLTYGIGSGWLTVNPTPNLGFSYAQGTITVQANTAGLLAGQTYTANLVVTPPGSLQPVATVPITLQVGAVGNVMTVSPQQLSLSTAAPQQTVTVYLNPAATVPYNISIANPALIDIPPGGGTGPTLSNGTQITFRAINPAAVGANTQTSIRIVPTGGYNEYTIPVTINPSTAGTQYLLASQTSVTLNAAAQNATVTIAPSTYQAVNYTMSLSQSLQTLITQGQLSIAPNLTGTSGTLPGLGQAFYFSAPNVSLITPTSGTVQFTPLDASYAPITVSVYINSAGTGTGSLIINPNSVTINATPGGTTPAAVPVSVTTSDVYTGTQVVFSAVATSAGNWLTINQQTQVTGFTPANLQVAVNPYFALTAGTFSGQITLTPQTGVGAGVPVNIPVTLNVAAPYTVTLTPATATIVAAAGGSAASTTVQAAVGTEAGTPAFTTSVSTTDNGTWLTASSSSTTLPAAITITANPAGLTVGNTYSGSVALVSNGQTVANIPVTFSVVQAATLQVSPATLAFTHQTTSTTLPPAQTVQITTTGASVGWSATAVSMGNWLAVSPVQGASTPGVLSVSVNPAGLTLGTYQGTISVSSSAATNSPQTIAVSLTVVTPSLPQVNSILNAGSLAPTVAVPGMIFTLTGADLGPATPSEALVSGGMFPTSLGGVRVLFDGIPAPLLYVSANQINAVMPFELYGRFSTRMQVEYRNQVSRELELRVADVAPGVFTQGSRGTGAGSILNQNNSVNTSANPEARGNVIAIYMTGGGQTNPSSSTGRITGAAGSLLTTPARVMIGGRDARVLYAGPAPGLVGGAVQVNAMIPQDAPTGDVPVTVQIGGSSSQSNVTVSVR